MRLKNTTTRKRKRKFKRVLSVSLSFVVAILIMVAVYIFMGKRIQSSYISPLPLLATAVSDQMSPDREHLSQILQQENIGIKNIASTVDDSFIVQLDSGEEVIFSREKDLKTQVSSLQLILSRLTMEGKQFKKLDLRFDKPVIVL